MNVEEYNARVKYCNDNGMGIIIENGGVYSNKGVINIFCKDKRGNLLKSKEGK